MAAMNVQEQDDKLARKEQYVFSEDGNFTLKLHASRSAARQAAFFLPHLQPGMSLLDCGSGSGSITVGLAQAVAPGEVTGIEISETEVARARSKATAEGIANLHFEIGDITNLAFPAESFDAVFSHNVLEHVAEPLKALREMHRVLKPGGVIGIRDIDGGGHLYSPANALLHEYARLLLTVWEMAGGHPRIGRRLRGLLHEAGFGDVATSASYEVYGDPERLRFLAQIITSHCQEPAFVEKVVEHKLATREQVEAIIAEMQVWPDDPEALCALAHCEVVGRKK
jgi:ubiquinone/menaquinone biosynthesis C-methylase UbiE